MKNKQHKNTKQYNQVLQSHCDVCFTYFRKVQPKKIDQGLQILICTKCNCKTHKCCYDLQANSTYVNEKIREFICSRCQNQSTRKKQCFICHQTDGAMTVSEDGEVLHVFCAFYHNEIQIVSYTPKIRVKKSLNYIQSNNNCDICKKSNAFELCAFENCKKSAHSYCVKKLYCKQQQQSDQPKCWNHHLTCVNNNIFDLSEEIIPYSMFEETIHEELKEIEQASSISQIQIGNKEKIMKEKYVEYYEEAKQKKKNSKKIKRGGYSFISCPEHQYTPYCICQGTGQGDMVECQCCFTWYHMSCIKYSAKNEQQFTCSYCKSFYQLKKKIIDEVINNKNDVFEIKCDLPVKMSYMDVIWIMRAIDSRISKGNIAKMMKQLLKYPLRTSKMEKLIKIQNKNKLEVLCEEFYLQYFFGEEQLQYFKPLPVLGLDRENKPIKLLESIQKNKKLRELIVEVRNFFKRQGIVDEFKGIMNELDFKENAISDSYEKIIELSKSQQKYQEVPILKIKAQAYSFLQIVKKVNSGSIITITQLQQSVRKANLIENVPDYLIQPLTEKYQKIQTTLNKLLSTIHDDPYNLNQIKQICSKLTNEFKIEPPIFYQVYIEQRNFINFLYFCLAKQTGKQIQGQISLKNKLQQLILTTPQDNFECNQELIKALNNLFQIRSKANNPKYSFNDLQKIIQNLQKKTIKLQFKNPHQKIFKKQKLEYLFQKIKYHQITDNKILSLMQKYEQIKTLYQQVVERSLDNLINRIQLDELNEKCCELIAILQNYPLKIEFIKNNHKTTWYQSSKQRKEEINQLMTLSVQNQLQKNPLTINKLLDTLPKQNVLVKQYYKFKKQYNQLHAIYINSLAISSEKMQYFKGEGMKKTRREQITLNQVKPDLKKMNQILQSLTLSRVDFSKQIKQITKMINRALDLSHSIQKFCKSKQNFQKCNNLQELSQSRKEIEEYRKRVLTQSQIAINKQLTQLYHCQIHNRMRSNLVAGNFQLDKNSKLIKFAQEQKIGNTDTYFKLKEKFQTKNQKSKQINLIRNFQTKLKIQAQKQTDPIYKNLYNLRKTLQLPNIEQQTPKIPYIEELKQKNKEFRQKIVKLLAQGNNIETKVNLQQAKNILFQSLKNPFNLNNLNTFYTQIQRCFMFFNNWKRNQSLGKNILYNDQKIRDYEKLKFKVQELQNSIKQVFKVKNCIKVIETIQNIYQEKIDESRLLQNCILMEQNLENIQDNTFKAQENELIILAKRKYIRVWHKLIKLLNNKYGDNQYESQSKSIDKQKNKVSQVTVNFKKIRKLLYDCYYLLQLQLKTSSNRDIIEELKQNILFFEQLLMQIKFSYLQSNFNKDTKILNQWIDIDDLVYEVKVGASLDDQFFIYKPFEDLSKFRYRNLTNKIFDLITKNVKDQNQYKRNRPEEFSQDYKEEKITKKLSHVSKQEESQDSQKNSPNVTENSRKKIKDILSKNILKNQELRKYGSCQNQIKMIENQIFGEYHNDMLKYLEASEKFQKLFMKLQQCQQISKKIIKKQFEFKFIKLLVQNLQKISEIQNMMVNKIKQEKNLQQSNHSLQTSNLSVFKSEKIQEQENNNVLDMLATGNVKQAYKKQLVKQMKKIKQAKDKKKKKSKHSRRSRSRSVSPQARFSSESQQENLPSYIQKEYNPEFNKPLYESNLDILPIFARNDQPLMFDPEVGQEEIQDIEKKYPRGSVLKIKQFNLEFFLKNKGKLEIKANLYTLEDYKKVFSQLVDPGFSSLNIRKEKNDKQILDYLNKPSKKKYKFLITWIQAENSKQNQNLQELSQQANERHKIFGWQNEDIKVHVMSIRQFVQITRFSANIPNKTVYQECQQMFDTDRMVCLIQYPAQKVYELKQKYKNFSSIQRVDKTYQVTIPLPSYDAYEPIQPQMLFNPNMSDISTPNTVSIKPMSFEDPLIKQTKPVQFQGWNSSTVFQSETSGMTHIMSNNPFQQIRMKMGFGNLSPIMTDQEDNQVEKKQQIDLADSLLKSIETKTKFQSIEKSYSANQQYDNINYGNPQQYNYRSYRNQQQKHYNPQSPHNPMMGSHSNPVNPMRNMNPMNYQPNRSYRNQNNYNPQQQQQGNRYPQNNYYQNQYQNQHGNMRPQNNPMNYNMNRNRNPMFNPNNNMSNMQMNKNPQQIGYPVTQNQGNQQIMSNSQYPQPGGYPLPTASQNQGFNNQNRYQGGGYQ